MSFSSEDLGYEHLKFHCHYSQVHSLPEWWSHPISIHYFMIADNCPAFLISLMMKVQLLSFSVNPWGEFRAYFLPGKITNDLVQILIHNLTLYIIPVYIGEWCNRRKTYAHQLLSTYRNKLTITSKTVISDWSWVHTVSLKSN